MEIINLSSYDLSLFSKFIVSIDDRLDVKHKINSIFICTNENYKSTVLSIDSNNKVTENANYIGYGLAISKRNRNYIFIRESVALVINQYYCENVSEIQSQDHIVQLAYSVVLHEIGHCIDNVNRNLFENNKFNDNNQFKIKPILDYFYKKFSSEYNANIFVRDYISSSCIEEHWLNITTDYNNLMNDLNKIKSNYSSDQLQEIAISVLNSFKIFFTQFVSYLALSNRKELILKFIKMNEQYFKISFEINNLDDYFNHETMPLVLFNCILDNLENYGYRFVIHDKTNDAIWF